jgi:hypothetical protein
MTLEKFFPVLSCPKTKLCGVPLMLHVKIKIIYTLEKGSEYLKLVGF